LKELLIDSLVDAWEQLIHQLAEAFEKYFESLLRVLVDSNLTVN